MAIKKIGALIALDGEKEFKQNVTNCNKSLSALKSELGLVQAQYEGQENSLEALQKKHEVLSKALDEQKSKEEAVRKGLEHARESYEKVGAGLTNLNKQQESHSKKLEDLKQDYEKATDRLDKMTKSGNSSEQSIKKQEAVIQSLAGELKKEEAALDDVNLAISKGEKNYQTAGNRVKDWETKLNTAEAQVIKASSAVNKNTAYLKEAAQSTDQCAKSIDEFGKEVKDAEKVTMDFSTILQTNLANTLINLGKDAVVNAVKSVTSLETAQRQLQASTGATAGEMQQYKSVMEDLHNNNYGEDINDVAQSMALVKQYTGELDPSKLESMTENGIAMRDVFDMDLSETIRGVDGLVENMGVTSEEAFDLMARGAQNGLNKSGELADNIAEYSQLWGQAGFSAQEMFGILQNGLDSGAYNLDKVNDFVKEFGNSLADGRIEENLDSFSSDTKSLFYQWKQGKATTKDVFYSVINDISTATNKQEMLTLASNTWSALGEDNAMKVIASLNETNTAYDDVKGTMESIKDIKYDTLESRFTQLGKKFQTQVGVPIAEDVLPAIEDGLDAVIENMDSLVPAIGGVIASVGTFKTTMKLATVAQALFNTTVSATPIAVIATAVAGAATAIGIYAESAGEASEEVRLLAERNQQLYDSANEVSESAQDLVESYSNNTAEMEAQSKYAQILKEKIENLAETKGNDNEKTEVMRQYIAELNQLMPGLNLAYDEQTDSLTKNSDAIQEYLDNKQKEIELQAEEEHALELIKKRSELKMEAIKLEEEERGIKKELGTLIEGENEWYLKNCRSVLTLVDGKNEERRSYDALTEAQEKNSEALDKNKSSQELIEEDIKETQDRLQELDSSWEDATATQDENTESTNANAEAQQAAADANATAAQTIVETYMGMQETVAGVLESQMNMFEEFNAGTEISSEQLLTNMQSQIEGVTNWADNMALLADRGVNQGILDKLAEMGPQGTTYVEAFANMTDEQLQQANDMWSQSLDMKEGVNASVQGMIEEYTAALNGGKEHMIEVMSATGIDVSAGFGNGIRSGIEQGKIAVDELGKATIVQAKTTLDSHSPSKVFMGIGNDVVSGLAGGINNSQSQAIIAVQMLSQQLVTVSRDILNASDFSGIGQVIPNGIRSGVESASPALVGKVSSMCTNILDKVNDEITHERFRATGMEVPGGLISGIDSGINGVHNAAGSLVDAVTDEASSLNSWTLYMDGYNTALGLANGIYAGESEVINAVAQMCADAVAEAEYRLDINSPSKVFMRLGSYTAEGFGIGYEKEMQNVNAVIADSMAIPDVNSGNMTAGGNVSAQGSAFADAINLLQEYLPYLANIANKEVSLYPSRRQFETEVAQAADKGMEVIRKRAERR
ncbi:phage tail tape measure protein [Blautia producta]|uniref:phage tail tape measure protein n=1 Tax=Blautia producta TaxID=33035 RepID=UPI00210C614C|nr:phage tail tape measure protein [Blautia producta]MCQ5127579.1 phage tail tape measure protein [Blautia producta]